MPKKSVPKKTSKPAPKHKNASRLAPIVPKPSKPVPKKNSKK